MIMNLTQKSPALFKELRIAIAPLEKVNPLQGLARIIFSSLICFLLAYIGWSSSNLVIFAICTFFAAIFYAFLIVCSHDAIHHTLTGWVWFDEIIARIISYPILSAVGTYSELHYLHHGWNGINLDDPERIQLTDVEYENLPYLQQWYFRYQWLINIFIGGAIGIVTKIVRKGWKHKCDRPNLRQQLILDITGILIFHSVMLTWILSQHLLWRYFLFWLIIERVVGIIIQTRDHLEHYGKWQSLGGQQLTQLYATRNLQVYPVIGWLMGGLNYHSVHHAFPQIPFNRLPEAYAIIQEHLEKYDLPPMDIQDGYIKTALEKSKKPSLIKTSIEIM